ncbi:alcohol dehydrogenase catalytic domain-containing protein [Thermodesulfobacteriota bacterium]
MKAAVVYGANDIRITEVPTPVPGPGEVLIKVKGSGVCATDVKILGGLGLPKNLPTILGHEVAGEIESFGDDVKGMTKGRRVAVYPIAACGECFFCRQNRHSLCVEPYGLAHGADGGFAEYVLVPRQIVRLGGIVDINDMPFDMAAMIEPISCCLSAANQCNVKPGDHVVIVGAGPLGLMHTIVIKSMGCRVIAVDPDEKRLQAAKEVGADITLNPGKTDVVQKVRDLTKVGADAVITAVGLTDVVESSFPLVRNGGVFNIFGGTPANEMITLDPRWLHYGEIILTGTFAASLVQFKSALDFVRANQDVLKRVISARCKLDDILDAVQQVKNGTALKSIIMFD